jgi:hypothetical protein
MSVSSSSTRGTSRARRENADAQAASTDGRAMLYANGQAHMFERKKRCNKKTTGGFKYKKTKPSIFSFPT